MKTGRLQDHKLGRNRKSLLSIVDAAGVGLKVRERDNAIAGLVWSGFARRLVSLTSILKIREKKKKGNGGEKGKLSDQVEVEEEAVYFTG